MSSLDEYLLENLRYEVLVGPTLTAEIQDIATNMRTSCNLCS